MDTMRDKGGVGEDGGHGAGAQHPPGSPYPVVMEVDGSALLCHCHAGLPGGSSPTTGSNGHHGHQQRAGCPQDCRTHPPPSSLGYPCEAAKSNASDIPEGHHGAGARPAGAFVVSLPRLTILRACPQHPVARLEA